MANEPIDLNAAREKATGAFKKIFQSGGKLSKFVILCLTGFILFFIVLNIFYVYVGPDEYGIRIKLVGSDAGVQKEIYQTGLNLVLPTINSIEKMPKNLQFIELTAFPTRYQTAKNTATGRAAHIQTSDGFYVDVDLSILYHITDPYKVMTMLGKKGIYENAILPKVEPALKRTLGKLTTEEFYDSHLRVQKMQEAECILTEEFSRYGLEVKKVLIRYFRYSEKIQKNIEDKKLKDQLVFKNQAEERAAKEAAILRRVIKEGEAKMAVLLEEGKAYVTKKRAELDLYSRTKKAEADLLVKLAEAQKAELKNDALKSIGSENLVGLEMAKLLTGVEAIILPSDGKSGLNPLNLNQTLKTFDVTE